MTTKTYYNIILIRAALALVSSEINPETAPAARLDSCQIEPETLPETWPRRGLASLRPHPYYYTFQGTLSKKTKKIKKPIDKQKNLCYYGRS